MTSRTWIKAGTVAGTCAVIGAVAGIAGSSAAPSHKATPRDAPAPPAGGPPMGGPGPGARWGGGPPVHSESVVLNKAGNGYITRTTDDGTVKSVSGSSLTITEGIGKVTYKDVTVTVPSDATIMRNGQKAGLGDLKASDHVMVASSSEGTTVFAGDDAHKGPMGGPGAMRHRGLRLHGGPPPAGAPVPPPGG